MKNNVIAFIAFLALTACVPKDQYNTALTELNYYRSQVEQSDSLRANEAISTYNNSGTMELELQRRIQEVESLTATNLSLNRSFQDLKSRYDQLLSQDQDLLKASGDQVSTLQQNLADRAAQVSEQEQILRQKEIELQSREQQLAQLESGNAGASPASYGAVNATPTTYGSTPAPAALTDAQSSALRQNQLQNQLTQTLINYPRNEVMVAPVGSAEVQITLSQAQMFSDGYTLSAAGANVLQRVAAILQAYPDAEVTIIGHSDLADSPIVAYENSTDRAINVAQNLISHGLNPRSILAAGQGYYAPVAGNNTSAERAANRRTVIVIALP